MYKILTVPELAELKNMINQMGTDPKYMPIREVYVYIMLNGNIREDVNNWFFEHNVFSKNSVEIIEKLIRAYADPEWFDIVLALEKKEKSSNGNSNEPLFMKYLEEAYDNYIPAEIVAGFVVDINRPGDFAIKIREYIESNKEYLSKIAINLKEASEIMKQENLQREIDYKRNMQEFWEKAKSFYDVVDKMQQIVEALPK